MRTVPSSPAADPIRRKLARFAARHVRTRTVTARAHPPLVSFTFDDIPETAASTGAAILEAAGVRGTFYVAGSLIGQASAADPGEGRHASARDIAALHREGHEIGCHSFAHRPVSALGRAELAADLTRNAARFAELDPGLAPTNFAYPFNTTSLRAKRQLERHFASCRGGVPGINAGTIDLGYLRAVELADYCLDAERARAWIDRALVQRGWLVFFSHAIGEAAGPWGCRPGLLCASLEHALERGARVVTMREALALVTGEKAEGRPS